MAKLSKENTKGSLQRALDKAVSKAGDSVIRIHCNHQLFYINLFSNSV